MTDSPDDMTGQREHASKTDATAPNRPSPLQRLMAGFNPGWPFLLVGLAVVAAVMLVPAWRDLVEIRQEQARLLAGVDYETRRVARTEEVLDAVARNDQTVQERLVAWQWNLVPSGETALARELHTGGVLGWVDDSVEPMAQVAHPPPPTRLEHLVAGPARTWMLAGGMLCVFIGLVGFPDRLRA